MTFERSTNDFADYTREPLASESDVSEFREGIAHYIAGDWHEDRWKTFRLRFGIYEQRQAGEHMIRLKQPGGRLSLDQARTIAKANAAHGGGDIHITTRQGIQLYFIALKKLAPLVESLNHGGVTTREASGNTFRAITACPKAGFCGAEHADAADTASELTKAWLRHPLVQHMPRKFKTTVSGCDQDCGLSAIDDLGFIATEWDGQKGFRVVVGGGLGNVPSYAVEVFDFVLGDDLPAVQEAVARVHIAHSNRANKNRSRIKFLVKQFGADEFIRLVHEQYAQIQSYERRAFSSPDWAEQQSDAGERRLRGLVDQADQRKAVGIEIPLGWLTSAQLETLADLTEEAGGNELRLTRDQNILAVGLRAEQVDAFVAGVRNVGLDASGREHALDSLVSCPGTYTCAIGITDSHALAESLIDAGPEFDGLPSLKVRVSGCHNSCGHHHIADIGFHGIAKKIGGKPAPHYQLHLGGSANQHGITGPFIPAKRAKEALRLLLEVIKADKQAGETVRDWAERVGPQGIEGILAPVLKGTEAEAQSLRFDIADDKIFVPPATSTGECAAGAVVAEHLSDLARVARQDVLRAERAGLKDQALAHVNEALQLPAQRLLVIAGTYTEQKGEALFEAVREQWSHKPAVVLALSTARDAQAEVQKGTEASQALPALQGWQNVADEEVERLLASIPGFLAGAAQ